MRGKFVLYIMLVVIGLGLSACEKNDYQHPRFRTK